MSAPLTIRFATDHAGAKAGIQDLAASVVSNMVKVSDALNTGVQANGGYAATVRTLASNIGNDFAKVGQAGLKAANDSNLSAVATATAVGKAAAETKTASVATTGALAVASGAAQFHYTIIRNEAAATARLIASSPLFVGAAAGLTTAVAGFLLVSAAVEQANAQIDRFIKLGANAEGAGVGVEFWQRFSEAAEKAKLDTEAVQKALKNAGNVVTPKFEQEDTIKKQLNKIFESGYTGDYQSKGLAGYNAAGNNEERIRAAVTAMQELRDLGEQLAAVDLAEKLFGSDTAERIRSGRLDIDAIARSLDRKRDDLVTQAEVDRASEFRERLDAAYKTIGDFLFVSVALEGSGRQVLDLWVGIAEGVAKATVNVGNLYTKIQDLQGPLGNYLKTLGTIVGSTAEIFGKGLEERATGTRTIYDKPIGPERPAAPVNAITNPPAPPRRDLTLFGDHPQTAPKSRGGSGGASDSFDAVETFINGLEKTAAAAKAEAEAFGKSNAEKQTAINLAKLKETADQQGIALTDAQIAKVKEASSASARYREQLQNLEQAQRQMAEASRAAWGAVSDGIADAVLNGKSFMSILHDLSGSAFRSILQGLLTGQGGWAGLLGTAPAASAGSNAVGGLAGLLASSFGSSAANAPLPGAQGPSLPSAGLGGLLSSVFSGFRANGGPVKAGRAYTVGEIGQELFVPGTDGTIVPAGRGQGPGRVSGDGGFVYAPTTSIDARGADAGMEQRLRAMVATSNAEHRRTIGQELAAWKENN